MGYESVVKMMATGKKKPLPTGNHYPFAGELPFFQMLQVFTGQENTPGDWITNWSISGIMNNPS